MKIFVIGMPQSGRTTIAKALCQDGEYKYVDASSWIKCTFRDVKVGEHQQQYLDDYHQWLTARIKVNPWLFIDEVCDVIKTNGEGNFIIDGINSPKDFSHLFNYQEDMVVFFNRTDNECEYKDYENIGVSVIRDYCYWMSAAGLVTKDRWLEYNFKINEAPSDHIKCLGSKNSVYIVKSISKVIEHLRNNLKAVIAE